MSTFKLTTLSLGVASPDSCGSFWLTKKFALQTMGYKKYVCPFGVLIVGDDKVNEQHILNMAEFVAKSLDKN